MLLKEIQVESRVLNKQQHLMKTTWDIENEKRNKQKRIHEIIALFYPRIFI